MELAPKDIQLGNFIYAFGFIEMCTGLIPTSTKEWYVCHKRWHRDDIPMPAGVTFIPEAIPLTKEWKEFLSIDKMELPDFIKYVHQAQNYCQWGPPQINLLDVCNWDLFAKCG